MLDRRDNAVGLNAADGSADYHAGQQGIFACIFEIAAITRIAHEVGTPGKQNVEPFCPRFGPDRRPSALDKSDIKGSSHCESGGNGVASSPGRTPCGFATPRLAKRKFPLE